MLPTPRALRQSEITGKRKRIIEKLPNDRYALALIVASVINKDPDALDYEDKYGRIERWDTRGITSMRRMFTKVRETAPEQTVDLGSWDTSNVTDMSSMFSLTPPQVHFVGLGSWDTSSVENMSYMFYRARGVELADGRSDKLNEIEGWKTHKVKDMTKMFGDMIRQFGDHSPPIDPEYIVARWDLTSVLPGLEYNHEELKAVRDAQHERAKDEASRPQTRRIQETPAGTTLYTPDGVPRRRLRRPP